MDNLFKVVSANDAHVCTYTQRIFVCTCIRARHLSKILLVNLVNF